VTLHVKASNRNPPSQSISRDRRFPSQLKPYSDLIQRDNLDRNKTTSKTQQYQVWQSVGRWATTKVIEVLVENLPILIQRFPSGPLSGASF
jgi:hypothetical protein